MKDPYFLKRMKTALCPGLFELTDFEASRHIINNCITHCDNSRDVLAKVLQSKFIADRSPFYWVLAGSDSAARHLKIPPLLTMFLEVCTSLSEETQEEITDVLLKINQDTLLKQLCARLPHICGFAMIDVDFNQATVVGGTGSAAAYISFTIPQFFDRLLINHEIVLAPCISNGEF